MSSPYYLLVDCETTGMLVRGADHTHPDQPRIVQLAGMLVHPAGNVIAQFNSLVKPNDFTIPAAAIAVHGISQAKAEACGVSLDGALRWLDWASNSPVYLVGHNISYDRMVIASEYQRRAGRATATYWLSLPTRCTMLESVNHCRLPGRFGSYKWPKLAEAYLHFTGQPLTGAHDALVDLEATLTILRQLDAAPTTPATASAV